MGAQLLVEELSPEVCGLITESSPDGKKMWLSGIFMQGAIKNRNGRTYPINEIAAAVTGAAQRIKESNGIMGELDHPQTLTINLDRVSHVITELSLQGNDAIGKALLLGTPMGLIAQELSRNGIVYGISSRGAGNVNEGAIVSGYNFITADLVATPSAPNAYPKAVYESLEMAKNGKEIMTLAESLRHDPAAQKYFKKEILNWLKTNCFKKGA